MGYPVFILHSFFIPTPPLLTPLGNFPEISYPDPNPIVQLPRQTEEYLYRIQNRIDEHSPMRILGIPFEQLIAKPIRAMERILPLGWKEQDTTIRDEDQQTPDTLPVFQVFGILITHLDDQLRKQPQLPAAGHFPPIYRRFKIADAFLYPPSLPETPDYILQRNETEGDK